MRLAFALGYLSARQRTSKQIAVDSEFVEELCPGAAANREVVVSWSAGGPLVKYKDPQGIAKVLSGSSGASFACGVLSASLELDETREGSPTVTILSPKHEDTRGALHSVGASQQHDAVQVGAAAFDLLGRLVEGAVFVVPSFLSRFEHWRCRIAHVVGCVDQQQVMRVQLARPDAVVPRKEHVSDSGYDLTLLYEAKRHGRTVLYGTGVIVEPPYGWYFDVVPRSSIIKRGYILANSVGVIDRSYRGEIFVPLIKIDPEAPELEMPARVAQLIPRPIAHFPVVHVQTLSATQRGAGGFGSTGS